MRERSSSGRHSTKWLSETYQPLSALVLVRYTPSGPLPPGDQGSRYLQIHNGMVVRSLTWPGWGSEYTREQATATVDNNRLRFADEQAIFIDTISVSIIHHRNENMFSS